MTDTPEIARIREALAEGARAVVAPNAEVSGLSTRPPG